jgi:hypothetical protein
MLLTGIDRRVHGASSRAFRILKLVGRTKNAGNALRGYASR